GRFQCRPGDRCFPEEWRCDGHPDCQDEEDERGCETATPDSAWVTAPRSSEVPPAGGAGMGRGGRRGSRGRTGVKPFITVAFSLPAIILVAVGSVAVWGLSRAKDRSDIFSLEGASRDQLMPDKSQ
ncbi:RSVR protein, partial [Nycticryphes semicollaris]|nr:RSVR protein [Nycticryphes semicollaris]